MIAGIVRSSVRRYTVHHSFQLAKPRYFVNHRVFSSHTDVLEKAKEKLNQLTEDPGNEAKLKLYGLYKQATIGVCNTKKPGVFDLVGQAKWNAWYCLGDLSQEEAAEQYSQCVLNLVGEASTAAKPATTPGSYQDLLVNDTNGVRTITLNRPTKYNAINYQMYRDWIDALSSAASDKNVNAVVITGTGKYYCSGNDLTNFAPDSSRTPQEMASAARLLLRDFVDAFIDFPKPLAAAVNGPAVGIAVTTLGLCDLVYCTDNATFHTPFMELGQSPEACSAFIFPKIMGYSKANEVLLMGHKMTADEAFVNSLVTRVFPDDQFEEKVKEIVDRLGSLPPMSLRKTKELIRGFETSFLKDVNEKETLLLEERWQSEECFNAIMKFMQRKN